MARGKSWVWEYYHRDSTKVNSTFYGARCIYCTKRELKIIQDREEDDVRNQIAEAVRPMNVLLVEGMI